MKYLLLIIILVPLSCSFITSFDESSGSKEICNNFIDDDGDNLTDCDDPSCDNDENCIITDEVCDDGVDNDRDGWTDCQDSDCASEARCDCNITTVFFDSESVCLEDDVCMVTHVNGGEEYSCFSADHVDGGEYYGPCGAGDICPVGSFCFNNPLDGNKKECAPYCSKNHPQCPETPDDSQYGICFTNPENSPPPNELSFCVLADNCIPTEPDSCEGTHQSCLNITVNDDFKCYPAGDRPELEECNGFLECAPGMLCLGLDEQTGTPGHCIKYCDLGTTCDYSDGTHNTCNGSYGFSQQYGFCIPSK